MKQLLKYRIGLGVIGVFVLVLLVIVLVQAKSAKQDSVTQKAADSVAEKLNNYTNGKGDVPESLDSVDAKDVPSTITYKKVSSTKYRLCITYRSAQSQLGSGSLLGDTVERGLYGSTPSGYNYNSSDDSGYLFLDGPHKKGENCHTVTVNSYDYYTYGDGSDLKTSGVTANPYTVNSDGTYTVCNTKAGDFDNEGQVSQTLTATSTVVTLTGYSSTTEPITSTSKFFDEKCDVLKPSDIQKGDTIDIYTLGTGAGATNIFLRRDLANSVF